MQTILTNPGLLSATMTARFYNASPTTCKVSSTAFACQIVVWKVALLLWPLTCGVSKPPTRSSPATCSQQLDGLRCGPARGLKQDLIAVNYILDHETKNPDDVSVVEVMDIDEAGNSDTAVDINKETKETRHERDSTTTGIDHWLYCCLDLKDSSMKGDFVERRNSMRA